MFTVYTVLGDGNVTHVLTTDDPIAALHKLVAERVKYKDYHHHAHGVFDPDNPENGDLEGKLEEIEQEVLDGIEVHHAIIEEPGILGHSVEAWERSTRKFEEDR